MLPLGITATNSNASRRLWHCNGYSKYKTPNQVLTVAPTNVEILPSTLARKLRLRCYTFITGTSSRTIGVTTPCCDDDDYAWCIYYWTLVAFYCFQFLNGSHGIGRNCKLKFTHKNFMNKLGKIWRVGFEEKVIQCFSFSATNNYYRLL